MPKVSVTIITKNEEHDIAAALASVAWADEIVVVDSGSTDRTVAVARRATDRVLVRDWPGYVAQKNFAAAQASHDWILSLDADERVTPALASEIRRALESPAHAAYRHATPDVAPRPLDPRNGLVPGLPDRACTIGERRSGPATYVHEAVAVNGSIGRLHGDLRHFAYRDIADHLETIDRYTTYAARQMQEAGRRASLWDLTLHPPLAFLRNYVAKGGFRLGTVGLIVSAMNAYYVFLKFAKLWQLQTRPAPRPDDEAGASRVTGSATASRTV